MDNTEERQLDPRSRQLHPERIVFTGETFVRNDVQARELGISERSVNRDDRLGAPFIFIGGVKYRPAKRYADFSAASKCASQHWPSESGRSDDGNERNHARATAAITQLGVGSTPPALLGCSRPSARAGLDVR